MSTKLPFISVITPVYNGADFISECIESVINQSYKNWEYIIVNNCSTDSTLDIATHYANIDSRIRIVNNTRFVDVIENHNIAFGLISSDSKYCKVVSADDWIYPECIACLVEVAEDHPSVAIVGSYAILTARVIGIGLPLRSNFFLGREVCRLRLLGAGIFGAPTTLLYRADLVRNENPFYTISTPNADIDTTFRILQNHDFGFVHQILTFMRVHDGSVSYKLKKLDSFLVDDIESLIKYGSDCLCVDDYNKRKDELINKYYDFLAYGILRYRDSEFWNYHNNRMKLLGLPIRMNKLIKFLLGRLVNKILNPKQLIDKIIRLYFNK